MLSRSLESPRAYSQSLANGLGKTLVTAHIFAKILSHNDDSGRHGVVIPTEIYEFFPELKIDNPDQNTATFFSAFDCVNGKETKLSYKYYQRYPERRITRLNGALNRKNGARMAVFMRAEHTDGSTGYYVDAVIENVDTCFPALCKVLFGDVPTKNESFILLDSSSTSFSTDDVLKELLSHFDRISSQGYINTLRAGDTGIGYTFEFMAGVEENNDKTADFKGIEIKCKHDKGTGKGSKINLFQQAPAWHTKSSNSQLIKNIGQPDQNGFYRCYSQVTTKINNLGLWLDTDCPTEINLLKNTSLLGYWSHKTLEQRLLEKHSRAVFIKAKVLGKGTEQSFHYTELVYCERPLIQNFKELVGERRIVFEFMMSEKGNGVRNHGYPWRLLSEEDLPNLFSLRVKIR
ncbi:MvaI/BcnI family restriction endonuclease [Pseudomonas sp. B1-22]|uniref:MvaI/BcnI family restriction endonuclease n=1 Tax=Pseudomonas sp. B1-22 TaxID=3141456 RepID=UPI003D296F3A